MLMLYLCIHIRTELCALADDVVIWLLIGRADFLFFILVAKMAERGISSNVDGAAVSLHCDNLKPSCCCLEKILSSSLFQSKRHVGHAVGAHMLAAWVRKYSHSSHFFTLRENMHNIYAQYNFLLLCRVVTAFYQCTREYSHNHGKCTQKEIKS